MAISLTPTFCYAQDVFGTLNASLDGVERTWFLTSQDTESHSFGMTVAIANMQSFSLWGQPTDKTVNDVKDSLLLGFDVMSVGSNTIPLNMSLTYLADGWKSGWLANEADQIVFSLTTLEKLDDGILVEGNFAAATNYSDALSSGQVDPSRTMQINGSFSATLPNYLLKER
ncbi:MAG: hypothetical protein QNK42_02615 [Pseudodonghicola sp.]|nr:hypothetical protein [Pseudodonghicola sp.]